MNFTISSYTSLGKRQNNEDALAVVRTVDGILAVVADGLGGMNYGEYASKTAIDVLREDLKTACFSEEALEDAIHHANQVIYGGHDIYPEARTTIAALWMYDNRAIAMHVGDTRIYHFRDGGIWYQSMDHSVAQLAVKAGDITLEEIRSYDRRNVLIRALGTDTPQKITRSQLELQKGDRLLICSDGFWETIWEDQMISKMSGTEDAEKWLSKMREDVEPVADDNNTAIAIQIS